MGIFSKISSLFTGKRELDSVTAESLSDALLAADIAPDLAESLVGKLRARGTVSGEEAKQILFDAMRPIVSKLEERRAKSEGINNDKLNNRPTDTPQLKIPSLCDLRSATSAKPLVLLIIGVNGAGKTTTIGKLAKIWHDAGKHVVIGAADTFRAAAGPQLAEWANRAGAVLVSGDGLNTPKIAGSPLPLRQGAARDVAGRGDGFGESNNPNQSVIPAQTGTGDLTDEPTPRPSDASASAETTPAARAGVAQNRDSPKGGGICDPATVAYRAVEYARENGGDIVILDTAGRLHNRTDLMDELAKITRVIKKLDADAPHETWLVLDATTGKNATAQIEHFHRIAPLSGLIVTKMDSTSKGGFLVTYAAENKTPLPVRAIGYGEKIADLRPFDTDEYLDKLLDK